MFKRNKDTGMDTVGNSKKWTERLMVALFATGISISGYGVLNYRQTNEEHKKMLMKVIEDDKNQTDDIFQSDRNFYTMNDKQINAENSSIVIVITNNNGILHKTTSGTGVVIRNSSTPESGNHNVILSASHLIDGLVEKKDLEDKITFTVKPDINKCDEPQTKCYAYTHNGFPLGILHGMYSASLQSGKMSIDHYAKNDIVMFKISPVGDIFDNLPGVDIAPEVTRNPIRVNVQKDYIGRDGQTYQRGIDHGASGGGIFDSEFRLLGVLDSGFDRGKGRKMPNAMAETYVAPRIINNGKNITLDALRNLMIKGMTGNTNRYSEGLYAPLGNSEILNRLGQAGKRATIQDTIDGQNLTVIGYPAFFPLVAKATMVQNTHKQERKSVMDFSHP